MEVTETKVDEKILVPNEDNRCMPGMTEKAIKILETIGDLEAINGKIVVDGVTGGESLIKEVLTGRRCCLGMRQDCVDIALIIDPFAFNKTSSDYLSPRVVDILVIKVVEGIISNRGVEWVFISNAYDSKLAIILRCEDSLVEVQIVASIFIDFRDRLVEVLEAFKKYEERQIARIYRWYL